MDFMSNLQSFTESLPSALQFLGIAVAAFVPYIEGEGAAIIGAIAGINPWIAIPVAIIANVALVALIVLTFERIRAGIVNRRIADGKTPKPTSEKQQKVRRALDKYGVPGVSLLGPFLLPTYFTAAALASFGVGKGRVIVWQAVAISLYAVVFGALAYGVINAIS
ncbi:small multi-drug export protein [Citricoccus nitrophenolicus]|uniref:small multi-drug export protein n=1 Tax=Citricoccus nitrophenolicus TaxID=863575 RepID=UPI0039B564EF